MTATTKERPKNVPVPKEVREAADEHPERLALENARAVEALGERQAYAAGFRARRLEEVDRLEDADPFVFGLAHSRAAVASWEWTGLHPKHAGGVQLQVQTEERARLGLERPADSDLREAATASEEHDEEVLRVPGRVGARGDRVWRGGSRR